MKWKVSEFGYYCLNVLYGLVFLLWVWLLTVSPIRGTDDLLGSLQLLMALEGLFFLCSPVLQRKVTIDESFVTEKWLWWRIDRVALSDITDIGLCVMAVSGHVRQYVFLSAFPVTDAQPICIRPSPMSVAARSARSASPHSWGAAPLPVSFADMRCP